MSVCVVYARKMLISIIIINIFFFSENPKKILQQTNNYSESSQTMTLTSFRYCAKYISFTGNLASIQYLIFYMSNLVSIWDLLLVLSVKRGTINQLRHNLLYTDNFSFQK